MIRPSAVRTLTLLSATCLVRLALAQEPEVIVLDPNHPLIQQPGTVHPGPAPPVDLVPLPAQGVNAREVLAGLWFRYRALVQQGAANDASRQIESALDFMKREGLRTSPEIAGAFLAEARRALEEGDYRRSKEDYVLAAGFAPGDPAARFGLAWLLLRGDRDPGSALKEWWAGLRVLAADPESLYTLAANGFLALFLGLGAGALAALALLSLKMAPAFFHDLQERSGGRLSEDGARLLGWALLALPAAAMLPLVWSVAAWAALFSAYFRGAEKLAAVTALLFLAATGPCAHLLSWQFGTAADPGARALIQWARRGPDLQQAEVLITLAKNHPQEAIFPFLLASGYRIAGRFDQAIDLYHDVLAIDSGDARALVNLGNLHALRGEYPVAQTYYRKAIEVDPRLALAHYNSHLAHLETFHLEAADAELKEARRLDEASVAALLGDGNEGRSRRTPVDTGYTSGEIWKRALRLRLEGGVRGEALSALTAPATLAGGLGLLGTLVWPGIGFAPRSGGARRCRRCGRPYCRRCQMTTKYPDVCSQCMHLFILKDGVAPGVKAKKLEEVARHRRRIFVGARLLSIPLPGSGHVLGGRAPLGLLLLIAWGTSWIGMLQRGQAIVSPEAIAPASLSESILPLIALAFVAWLWGNFTSHESAAG